MAPYANGFEPDRYLSRSWALLTRDSGWGKPVLVLALVCMIPIVGPVAVLGYILEWARLTAWGVDAAPKQRRVNVGQVLASGWRGTVIEIAWMGVLLAAMSLVSWLLGQVPGESTSFVPGLLNVVYVLGGLVLGLAMVVAQIRSAIYQKIAPGFRLDRVFQMVRRDLGGLLRMLGIVGLFLLVGMAVGLVALLLVAAVVVPYAVGFGLGYGMLPGQYALVSMLSRMFSSLAPIVVLCVYCSLVVSVVEHMLVYTGVALWMRQFDVPRWGKSADPLPESAPDPQDGTPVEPQERPVEEVSSDGHSGYQTGPYRPDEPGDEGQAGTVPGQAETDGSEDSVEHIL